MRMVPRYQSLSGHLQIAWNQRHTSAHSFGVRSDSELAVASSQPSGAERHADHQPVVVAVPDHGPLLAVGQLHTHGRLPAPTPILSGSEHTSA
jgi:hypothetical protein